jgi:hypothetical protein
MRIHVCGSRRSTQSPGIEFMRYAGHASCVAVEGVDGHPDLIDAGIGLRIGDGLLGRRPFEGAIMLGHLHLTPFICHPTRPGSERTESPFGEELDELAAGGAETPGPDVLLARQGMSLDVGGN